MKIKLTSVLVSDQESALRFYTEVLGFVKKEDIPIGEFRWLTVVSPEGRGRDEVLSWPPVESRRYSSRRLAMGSTRLAVMAGMRLARAATPNRTRATEL